jgi:hypothetical protein
LKTLTFKLLDLIEEDKNFILDLQKKRSVAYRKVCNNLELMQDGEFKNEIVSKYVFSKRAYEYLCTDVMSRYDSMQSINKNKLKLIEELKEQLSDKNISRRDKQKIQKDLSNVIKQTNNKNITFGGKDNLKKITKYNRLYKETKDIKYLDLLNKYKKLYQEGRILPLLLTGEANRYGNRFFDFSGISKGEVIFEYETLKRKVNLKFYINKGQRDIFDRLELLCKNKSIPVTIKLTTKEIHITFEEGIITGKYLDIKKVYRKISNIKDKEERKILISNAYKEHEEKNFTNKTSNRYCGIDLNPDGIGYCVADRLSVDPNGDFKIIKKGFIDLKYLINKKVTSGKRKHELSVAISRLFKEIEHLKVCNFVVEDLSGIHKTKSSREGNRKNKNVWNREYVNNLITKWCNWYGIKKIEIIPVYSSIIGNVLYKEYDPVSASIEITRRGMVKYIKGGVLLPTFHKGVITDIVQAIGIDYNELANVDSWRSLGRYLSATKKSVRRVKLIEFDYESKLQNRTSKSKVRVLEFQ